MVQSQTSHSTYLSGNSGVTENYNPVIGDSILSNVNSNVGSSVVKKGSNPYSTPQPPDLQWKPSVLNVMLLPTIGNKINDVRVVENNGNQDIYICTNITGTISEQWHIYSPAGEVSTSYVEAASANALYQANYYTDVVIVSGGGITQTFVEAATANALYQANSYTDTIVASVSGSVPITVIEAASANALYQANAYTDSVSGDLSTYIDIRDQSIYNQSKQYTNTLVEAVSGTIDDHNELHNIQGGDSTNRWHMDLAEYNDKASRTFVSIATNAASGEAYNQFIAQKAATNGVATLDAGGKIPSNQIPSLAISETYVIATTAALLLLPAEVGDLGVVTSNSTTYILQTQPASAFESWVQILTPPSPVQSVNNQIGNVSLTTTNIPEGTQEYFTTSRARQSISASIPIYYDSVTGVISITEVGSGDGGFLSQANFNIFNNKAPTNSPHFAGTILSDGPLKLTGQNGLPEITLGGLDSQEQGIYFDTWGQHKWKLLISGENDVGNIGSDLFLRAYDDAGVLIDTPMTITRYASGAVTFNRAVSGTQFIASTIKLTTAPTVGHVWTATDIDGSGNWAAVSAGTVTSVSIVSANGISGTVATATTTPAITLALGDITPTKISIAQSTTTDTIGIGITKLWSNLGNSTTTTDPNIFLGYNTGKISANSSPTEGTRNIGIGNNVLKSITSGFANIAIGGKSSVGTGYSIQTGSYNILLGTDAGQAITYATHNVFIGRSSGGGIVGSNNNIAIGQQSLANSSTALNNVAIGYYAMANGAGASDKNVAIGYEAGMSLTTGAHNVIIGEIAGTGVTTATYGVAIGYNAGLKTSGASNNVVNIGKDSGRVTGGGVDSINIGNSAGINSSGTENIYIGKDAGFNDSGRTYNVMVGSQAGKGGTGGVGSNNVFLGYSAGRYATGDYKIIIDNRDRSDTANELLKVLLYGVTSTTIASQTLLTNSAFTGKYGIQAGFDEAAGTTNVAGVLKLISAGNNAFYNTFTAGTNTANATYTLPTAMPAVNGYVLSSTDTGVLSWVATATGGNGDVTGPSSSVDDRIVLFSGITGKIIKSSTLTTADFLPVTQPDCTVRLRITRVGSDAQLQVARTNSFQGEYYPINTGEIIGSFIGMADILGGFEEIGGLSIVATETYAATARGSMMSLYVTAIGTTTRIYPLDITQEGVLVRNTLTLGTENTGSANVAGVLKIISAGDNAFYNTFTSGENTENATYTLPTALPVSNMLLQSTSAGVLSWVEAATGSSGGGITWTEVTGTTQSMVVDNGYIANNGSQVVCTLPSTCAVGKVVRVCGKGNGGWKIEQGSGQSIIFGNTTSTTGVGGYIESTLSQDTVELLCTTADTTFTVLSSVGTLTVA